MKLIFVCLAFMNWYYIPFEYPSAPVEVEGVDVHLKRNEAAFTFFSLSDGEAALIQHANGENMLLNTGGKGTVKELDRLLSLFKVKHISTVILTSNEGQENVEHYIQNYHVRQIVTGTSSFQSMSKSAQPFEVKVIRWKQGDLHNLMPSLAAEVVYDGSDENEGMDISFKFFHHQIFYVRSASHKAEQVFLEKPMKNVNIVKLPQYAEKGSFSDLLIEHLDPQLAIIFKSSTKKPDPALREMLHEAWIDVYFTQQHGTITVKLTDSNYDVITIMSEE